MDYSPAGYPRNPFEFRCVFSTLTLKQYYGGVNAPYTFAHFPGRDSWEMFDEILTKCQVLI